MFDRVSNSTEDLLANAILSRNLTGLWLISGHLYLVAGYGDVGSG